MSAVITDCRNSWQLLLIRLNGCTSIQPCRCCVRRVGVRQGLQFSSIFSAYKIVANIMHPTQPTDDAWKHLLQIAGPVALLWFCDGNQKLATMMANGWDNRRIGPPQQRGQTVKEHRCPRLQLSELSFVLPNDAHRRIRVKHSSYLWRWYRNKTT